MVLSFVTVNINYEGLDHSKFLQLWKEEAEVALSFKKAGAVHQIWKNLGEREVFIIVDLELEQLDQVLFQIPMSKNIGDQLKIDVTPIIPYKKFSEFIQQQGSKNAAVDNSVSDNASQSKSGSHFWLTITYNYKGHSQQELVEILSENDTFINAALAQGIVVDAWKCVGKRQLHLLTCLENTSQLDHMCFNLPIVKRLGSQVVSKCTALLEYESLYNFLCSSTQVE